jgi:DNA invertase Pin-like site-specific DNA recombinase
VGERPKHTRARRKLTKNGKPRGRPTGSRSHDPASSRADDPPIRGPEQRGRPPVALKDMILRFIQMEIGLGRPRFAEKLAVETGVAVSTVKRRLRRDRAEARKREKQRKFGRWTFK